VASDDLVDTIDYVALNAIAKEEMAVRAKLLEVVCQRMIDRIMNEHPMVQKAWVNVAKLNPPINGDVERVALTFTAER
jgi:dihydroneopterin aldolase